MTTGITDNVVAITDASSGPSEATARHLARHGGKLGLGVRRIERFARTVAFAIGQPADLDINEILFRPIRQEL